MTNRERFNAILHSQPYDRMPCVSFGYWRNTPAVWAKQGYIPNWIAEGYELEGDNSTADRELSKIFGFDFNRGYFVRTEPFLFPPFPREVLKTEPDGCLIVRDPSGLIVREKPGVVCISSEIGTSLTGREAWEEMYLPRLQDRADRVDPEAIARYLAANDDDLPRGVICGSMYGHIRNMLGVQELAYLAVDDEDLYREIIETVGKVAVQTVRRVLQTGVRVDYAHIWEDICFRNGPLIRPSVFRALVGPQYKALTEMLAGFGIDLVMVDCDGWIDALVPIWLENGVNTMFPIEVGSWNGCIANWRAQYGPQVRGIGGMDKRVLSQDRSAVDREIERLRPLVDLGGYLPCPDHMIPPDADFKLVAYYCEKFHRVFG